MWSFSLLAMNSIRSAVKSIYSTPNHQCQQHSLLERRLWSHTVCKQEMRNKYIFAALNLFSTIINIYFLSAFLLYHQLPIKHKISNVHTQPIWISFEYILRRSYYIRTSNTHKSLCICIRIGLVDWTHKSHVAAGVSLGNPLWKWLG